MIASLHMPARRIFRYSIVSVVHSSPICYGAIEHSYAWYGGNVNFLYVHTECVTRSSCADLDRDVYTECETRISCHVAALLLVALREKFNYLLLPSTVSSIDDLGGEF